MLYYTYDNNGTLVSVNIDGVEYFYQRNILGDVVGLYDINGYLVVTYDYDVFGNIINRTDTTGKQVGFLNPYRYRGYRYDEDTQLYYLNSRYYNPELGRFINADGYIGTTGDILSHNMYTYAKNNPIMYIDPSGYLPLYQEFIISTLIEIGINAIVPLPGLANILGEFASTIVINLCNKLPWDHNLLQSVAIGLATGVAIGAIFGVVGKVLKRFNIPLPGNLLLIGPDLYENVGTKTTKEFLESSAQSKINIQFFASKQSNIHKHHIYPREFNDFFNSKQINIDNFTVKVDYETHLKGIHGKGMDDLPGKWNERWRNFITRYGNEATTEDVYRYGEKLMDEFGLSGLPIIPYK